MQRSAVVVIALLIRTAEWPIGYGQSQRENTFAVRYSLDSITVFRRSSWSWVKALRAHRSERLSVSENAVRLRPFFEQVLDAEASRDEVEPSRCVRRIGCGASMTMSWQTSHPTAFASATDPLLSNRRLCRRSRNGGPGPTLRSRTQPALRVFARAIAGGFAILRFLRRG